MPADIVALDLEVLHCVLDLVDDGPVVEDATVVGKVHSLCLLGQNLHLTARIVVSLLEGVEGVGSVAAETERAGDLGPVDFRGYVALLRQD